MRTQWDARVTAGDTEWNCELVMISRGGALVVGLPKLRAKQRLRLHLLVDALPVEVGARVLYRTKDGERAAFGIEFLQLPAPMRERIDALVRETDLQLFQLAGMMGAPEPDLESIHRLRDQLRLPAVDDFQKLQGIVLRELAVLRASRS